MRHRKMLAPINSIKHYVQAENASLASGSNRQIVLVDGVSIAVAAANTFDVVEGSIVKAVFIELWVKSSAASGANTKFQLGLEKSPSGVGSMSFANMNNLMPYDNKKNILYYSQGVIGDTETQGIPVIRQWFLIPKGKQRFGLGDRLILSISTTGAALQICGFSTYKEYK